VFYSRTVFCIGANIEAIERFMNTIKVRGYGQQKHFALVGVKGKGWQTSADILKKRYGVEVIPYTYGNSEQLTGFMKKLAEAAPVKLEGTLKEQYSPIKKVILEDIGPFKKLELNLDNKWNVLLGDNGVGKSTILKAIAVGMCGDDAEPYAHRLIRNNSLTKSGAVTIITRKGKYITEIKDNVTKAAIKTNMRPIDTEGSLALGFPPLRTISWETKSETYAGKPIPLAEDILPIITGEVDPRMDKLKRWLVDLKGNATGLDPGDNRPKNKYTELIEKFFNIVDDLTPNLLVKYHQINTVSKQVLIETEDGIVPLEAISQGTLSLISWTGILLQRLYEVYSEGTEDPSQRYALVLMDELDAHMHPAWQRILIYKLKEIFPNIQFIVTTHSPLVVGGLPPEQIFKFQRTEQGSIVRAEVSKDDTVGRANQILTSNLFGLEVSLDVETEGILNEYKELAKNQSRTPEEEEKYKQLKREIKKRVGSLAENPDERNAQRRLEAWNIKQTSEIDQDEIDETIKYLEDSKKKQ
jgi:predicted ATPase